MCVTVLLTAGRTVGTQHKLLQAIDSAGSRSIVVRAQPGAGLTTSTLSGLAAIAEVDRIYAFGPSVDVSNVALGDAGQLVSMRTLYSGRQPKVAAFWKFSSVTGFRSAGYGVASRRAITQLGMADASGAVRTAGGTSVAVLRPVNLPSALAFLDPIVLQSAQVPMNRPQDLSILVVTAHRPGQVDAVAAALKPMLAVQDASKVTLETSSNLAIIRGQVQGQFSSFGRSLLLGSLCIGGTLLSAILYAFVMLRRKDYGRRRALGAGRPFILALISCQAAVTSLVGIIAGDLIAVGVMLMTTDPQPPLSFFFAVDAVAAGLGIGASILPGLAASTRDPLKELRIP